MATTTGATSALGSVMATFYTTTCPHAMPEQAYSIPVDATVDSLNQLVQSVLSLDASSTFDFLIDDDYITTTLAMFIRRRGVGFEKLFNIEYTPALQAQDGSKLPHDDWVSSVRAPVYGNAEFVVTGAFDHCVRVWQGDDCLGIGAAHKEAVMEVAVHHIENTPTVETTAAARGAKGRLSGTKRKHRESDGGALPTVVFVSGSKDGSVAVWDYNGGSQIVARRCFKPHVGSVDSIDVSPNGRLVATGSWDLTAKVFDWDAMSTSTAEPTSDPAPLVSFSDHARAVRCVRFYNSSESLLSAGLDGNIKLWDVSKAELAQTLAGEHSIMSLAVSTGGLILACNTDNRIRLYDPRHSKPIVKTFAGHRQWCYAAAWQTRREEADSASLIFASASEDATVRLWDLRCTSTSLRTLDRLHTDGVLDISYAGEQHFVSGGKDNKLRTFTVDRSGATRE